MIHDTILDHAEQHRGEPFEINLSAGEHVRGDVVLDANLPFSRLKITAANGASLSGMIEVRAGAPPVELHGLDIDGQVLIEAGFDRTVEIAGCRFRASASQGRRLQASTYKYSYTQASTFVRALLVSGGSVTVSDTVFEGLQGGAVEVRGGDLTVHTSAFEKNEAERGGALLVTGGEVRVYNSTFADNKANVGGAIRVIGTNAILELANLTQVTGSEGSGGSVASDVKWTYVLPGPLGHYVSKEQDGVARNSAGDYVLGDYPIPCLGGLRGSRRHKSLPPLSEHAPGWPCSVVLILQDQPLGGLSPAHVSALTGNMSIQVRQQLQRARSVDARLHWRLPCWLSLPRRKHRARHVQCRHILPSEIGGRDSLPCRDVQPEFDWYIGGRLLYLRRWALLHGGLQD